MLREERLEAMEDLYQVGVITQTHGVRGEVKVFPMTDDISRFKGMKNLILDAGKEGQLLLEVESARPQKNLVILKFKNYDNINDIEKYKKCGLYVTKENRVKLKKDEYFVADLIGLKAEDEDGEEIGEITDVFQTGANDVYELTKTDGRVVLLPAIKECILAVDVDGGRMCVHILPGLEDD